MFQQGKRLRLSAMSCSFGRCVRRARLAAGAVMGLPPALSLAAKIYILFLLFLPFRGVFSHGFFETACSGLPDGRFHRAKRPEPRAETGRPASRDEPFGGPEPAALEIGAENAGGLYKRDRPGRRMTFRRPGPGCAWKERPYSFCCTSISVNVSMMSPCWMSLKLTRLMPHSKLAATSFTSSL